MTIAQFIITWIIASIVSGRILAAFMGAHKRSGETEAGELADHLGVGGGADFVSHRSAE